MSTPLNAQQVRMAAKIALNSAYGAIRPVGKFKCLDQGPVDDQPWYTVQIYDREIWYWLTQQEGQWRHYDNHEIGTTLVDMEESVFLALTLKYS